MSRLLPLVLMIAVACTFGIAWIIFDVDPNGAPWYIFVLLVLLIFFAVFGVLGLLLYFVRTRFYKRYSVRWYIFTSFKMAFFVAFFASLVAILAILKLISAFNLILAILAVSLFAVWSYLGKRD